MISKKKNVWFVINTAAFWNSVFDFMNDKEYPKVEAEMNRFIDKVLSSFLKAQQETVQSSHPKNDVCNQHRVCEYFFPLFLPLVGHIDIGGKSSPIHRRPTRCIIGGIVLVRILGSRWIFIAYTFSTGAHFLLLRSSSSRRRQRRPRDTTQEQT